MTLLGILAAFGLGIGIGTASSMVGIGGGVLLIPALVLLYGMSQKTAQGTSIATLLLPIGIFAFWEYRKAGHVHFKLAMIVAVGFACGGYFGGMWAQHLSDVVLRRVFAVLLMGIAIKLAFWS